MSVETLRGGLGKLSANDRRFALSLLSAFDRGIVTPKQREWIDILAKRLSDSAATVLPNILKLVETANARGVEKIGIRLQNSHLTYSPQRRTIYVKDVSRTFVSKTDGKTYRVIHATIDENGTFHASRFGDATLLPKIREELTAFDENPHKASSVRGHATGRCCYCGRRLDNAESVRVGYGPICAERYMLPWGEEHATNSENVFSAVRT